MRNWHLFTKDANGLPQVRLDAAEAAMCESVAMQRYNLNLCRPNTYGLKEDGRDETAVGTYGEYVVALFFDLAWRPVVDNPWDKRLIGDVGGLQVRTTKSVHNDFLRCGKKDPDDKIFVLVQRVGPLTFRIAGWDYARDVKQDCYWGDPFRLQRPAFFKPRAQLSSIVSLIAAVRDHADTAGATGGSVT